MHEIITFAKEINAVAFFPTSALTDRESVKTLMQFAFQVGIDFASKTPSSIFPISKNPKRERDCSMM